jgi:hypothetical protein
MCGQSLEAPAAKDTRRSQHLYIIRLFPSYAAVLSLASRHDVSSLLGASLARFYAQAGASRSPSLSFVDGRSACNLRRQPCCSCMRSLPPTPISPYHPISLSPYRLPLCQRAERSARLKLARLPLASVLTLVSCGRTSPSTASSSPHTRASLSPPLHSLSPPTPLPSRLRLARCHPHVSGPEPSQMQLQVPDTQSEWALHLNDDLVAGASRWHRAAWLCRPAGDMYIVRRQAHASRLRLPSSPQQGRDAGWISSCAS